VAGDDLDFGDGVIFVGVEVDVGEDDGVLAVLVDEDLVWGEVTPTSPNPPPLSVPVDGDYFGVGVLESAFGEGPVGALVVDFYVDDVVVFHLTSLRLSLRS